MRTDKSNGTQDLHPIQVVARRTGLTPDVLRAWEKRYEAVTPGRTGGSRRLYCADDIERLILLKNLTAGGRAIGQIAGLPTEQLKKMLREDDEAARQHTPVPARRTTNAAQGGRVRRPTTTDPRLHLERCLASVTELDAQALEAAIERSTLDLGRIAALEQVLLPLMHVIGERWREGSLRIVHEHVTSTVVRAVLTNMNRVLLSHVGASTIIVATPAGQAHEFGALVAAATASSEGWRSLYLGAGLPAEEIAAAARQKSASAVALSLVYPADDPAVRQELVRLRTMLPTSPAILVGGAASMAYTDTLQEIGATRLCNMPDLREALERIHMGTG